MELPADYPNGIPRYWMHETSGVLRTAVLAYLDRSETPAQFERLRAYCQYWIDAPCWADITDAGQTLQDLRDIIRRVATRDALAAWFWQALALGIDPL